MWEEATGDSFIVDIRAVSAENREQACYEAAKYPAKLADITGDPQLVDTYLEAFKSRRMMWSFGHCFGLMTGIEAAEKEASKAADEIEREIADGVERTCPHCGAVNGLERVVGGRWPLSVAREVIKGWWVRGPSPG
jgi:hypothetical protein